VDYVKDNADQLSSEFNMGTALARIVLTAVAACEDPAAFGSGDTSQTIVPGGDYLAALITLHNGTQFTDGFGATDTLNDDIWGLLALVAAGEPLDSSIVTSTVDFIVANQGFDGGWSWATPDNAWYWGSDVDDTAAALMALAAAGYSDAAVIDMAVQYVQFNQGPSGGFQYDSFSAENLASTVWVVDAISAMGQDPTSAEWTATGNPIDFIMGYQQADGSFLDSAAWSPNPHRNTADAIITLTGNYFPFVPECVEAEYLYSDPRRGTEMAIIDTDAKTFRFTAPDGYDSGIVEADRMLVTKRAITIIHRDRDITVTFRANIKRDWATGLLIDRESRNRYLIIDPFGFE
jgi:iron complex transport system substrate-binding protein